MSDLKIVETGDGGDAVLKGNDLLIIEGFQNMPYLGLFGGNLNESTDGAKPPDEQAFDWWGNHLLMPNNPSLQFNSSLEKLLLNIVLSSEGRVEIISKTIEDLKFMNDFAVIEVDAVVIEVDRIEINIKITEPGNLESNEFTYIWDSTNSELSLVGEDFESTIGAGVALGNMLNFEL